MTSLLSNAADLAAPAQPSVASRVLTLLYGTAVYTLFLGTFLYMIGFVAGVLVPKHIDSGPAGPLGTALLVNGGLLAAFALQHAIMARPGFKRRWTRLVPPAAERSTFVLATCTVLATMVWQWRPMPDVVWQVEGTAAIAMQAASGAGWLLVLVATFLIDHFELFGLRQVVLHFQGRNPRAAAFRERSLYRWVRHPIMLGFLIAFWATPVMTVGHLFFALMCTGYILVGVRMEEADLVRAHGDAYLDYRRRVPGLLPLPRRR
ncbi:MAG: isoprenylcysteine carboxylmethyltransferase family protein [Planctomycetes bacterium]|nr:isoprenylcysteine carboxylmethyltransferase family protein [Planctomycetota bacterium]